MKYFKQWYISLLGLLVIISLLAGCGQEERTAWQECYDLNWNTLECE